MQLDDIQIPIGTGPENGASREWSASNGVVAELEMVHYPAEPGIATSPTSPLGANPSNFNSMFERGEPHPAMLADPVARSAWPSAGPKRSRGEPLGASQSYDASELQGQPVLSQTVSALVTLQPPPVRCYRVLHRSWDGTTDRGEKECRAQCQMPWEQRCT